MSIPLIEQILTEVKNRLLAIPGVKVERDRDEDVQEFPFLVLVEGKHDTDTGVTCGEDFHTQHIEVEGYVQAGDTDQAGTKRNELYAAVLAALMPEIPAGIRDTTLGGLVTDLRQGNRENDTKRGQKNKPTAGFSLGFDIDYSTLPGDPFTPA